MEVGFPTSRESFHRHSAGDFLYISDSEGSSDDNDNLQSGREDGLTTQQHNDVSDDEQSQYTSESDGFMGWGQPRRSSSSRSNDVVEENNNGNNGRRSPNNNEQTKLRETSPVEVEEQTNSHADSSTNNGGDDTSDKMAKVKVAAAVEFPTDGTPFRTRNSIDSYHSIGSSSKDDAGGSDQNSGGKGGDDGDSSDSSDSSSDNDSSTTADLNSSAEVVGILPRQSSLESMDRSVPTKGEDVVHRKSANKSPPSSGEEEHGQSTLETSMEMSNDASSPAKGEDLVHRRSSHKSPGGEEERPALETIESGRELLGPMRRNSELRRSLHNSLAKQISFRESMEQKLKEEEQEEEQEQASTPQITESWPSTTELHDENAIDLPILGWDKDTDNDDDSFCPSVLGKSGRSGKSGGSTMLSLSGGGSANRLSALASSLKSSLKSSLSRASFSSSLKESQRDGDYGHDGVVYEEFGTRHHRRSSFQNDSNGKPLYNSLDRPRMSSSENRDKKGVDLLMAMMEEEYDPRKPWRKAPSGGDSAGGAKKKKNHHHTTQHHAEKQRRSGGHGNGMGRRASGLTMRSSFTSDMSFGEIFQELQQPAEGDLLLSPMEEEEANAGGKKCEGDLLLSPMEEEEEVMAVSTARRHAMPDGDSLLRTEVSALSDDDDDCSELTELRQAQEVLFPVPESVSTSIDDSERSGGSIFRENRESQEVFVVKSSAVAAAAMRNKDLSSLDIVQKPQPHFLAPVEEGSDGERAMEEKEGALLLDDLELDDLPTSTAGLGTSFKRSSPKGGQNNRDDDSVSYSDIDVEQGMITELPPSVKMCMTVRNSMIEREFDTEQLLDIEFGQTKPDEEMTLGMFLDPGQPDDAGDSRWMTLDEQDHHDFGNNLDRSNVSNSSSTLGTSRTNATRKSFIKKSVISQTAKLDNKATRHLRRKNKRLWKFCVWNCRKITLCLVVGLCLLAGIAALTWWGATKATEGGDDNENVEVQVEEESGSGSVANNGESLAPTGSESKQWPPAATDSGRIPPPVEGQEKPTQFPSLSPSSSSLRRNSSDIVMIATRPPEEPPSSKSSTPSISQSPSIYIPSAVPSLKSSSPSISPSPSNYIPSAFPSPSTINTNNNSSTPIYSYIESEEQLTTPSFTPSKSSSPSSSAKSSVLNISSHNVSVYPSSSPSSNNASFIQSPSVNSTSAASLYPSLSPPSNSSFVEPSLSNASSIENPSVNSTSAASLYPSLSPPSNSSSVEPSLSNASSIQSPSVNSTILVPSVNSSTASSVIMNNQSQLIPPSDISPVYESIQMISGMKESEYAGASVSINPTGDFMAVGFKEANGPVEKTGLVRVYQLTSDNMLSPIGVDSMFGRGTGDEFGASVSISNDGKRVAVGSRSSSLPDKPQNGEVKVFEYSQASNSWFQLGSSIQGMEEKDRLGFSVSISGDGKRVAVGAPRGNGGTGSASIHEYNGLDWILFGDIVVSDYDGDRTGFSVSLSNDGNTLAVGAFTSSNGDLATSGSVSVYTLDSLSLVNQGQTLVGTTDGAQFGYSVSLSGDGRRLVVGSKGFHTENATKTGLCVVYELQAQNWTRIGALAGNKENEEAGSHVSMSKTGSVVSCSKSTFLDGNMKGAVAVLEENEAEWNVVDTIISSHGNSTSFGASVSLSQDGKTLLAGAPSYNSSAGFFELFARFG